MGRHSFTDWGWGGIPSLIEVRPGDFIIASHRGHIISLLEVLPFYCFIPNKKIVKMWKSARLFCCNVLMWSIVPFKTYSLFKLIWQIRWGIQCVLQESVPEDAMFILVSLPGVFLTGSWAFIPCHLSNVVLPQSERLLPSALLSKYTSTWTLCFLVFVKSATNFLINSRDGQKYFCMHQNNLYQYWILFTLLDVFCFGWLFKQGIFWTLELM